MEPLALERWVWSQLGGLISRKRDRLDPLVVSTAVVACDDSE